MMTPSIDMRERSVTHVLSRVAPEIAGQKASTGMMGIDDARLTEFRHVSVHNARTSTLSLRSLFHVVGLIVKYVTFGCGNKVALTVGR